MEDKLKWDIKYNLLFDLKTFEDFEYFNPDNSDYEDLEVPSGANKGEWWRQALEWGYEIECVFNYDDKTYSAIVDIVEQICYVYETKKDLESINSYTQTTNDYIVLKVHSIKEVASDYELKI